MPDSSRASRKGAASEGRRSPDVLDFLVPEEADALRLDAVLADLSGVSRSQVRRWIDDGRVLVDGVHGRPSQRLTAGAFIAATPPELETPRALAEDIPLVILHEDEDVIVVDKPAGMVVHPAPGHETGTLVNALLHHCGDTLPGVGGVLRPGIVHRLDRGTSGVMVAAKSDLAHADLSVQFHDHTTERVYEALVRGAPGADEGRVDGAIGRHPRDRKRMSLRTDGGREAITRWRVAERFPRSAMSRLSIRPETGRTHQIRVHLASSGLPICGDPVYGRARKARHRGEPPLDRPALHARVLAFRHPASGETMRFETPLPEDMAGLVDWLRAREATAVPARRAAGQ